MSSLLNQFSLLGVLLVLSPDFVRSWDWVSWSGTFIRLFMVFEHYMTLGPPGPLNATVKYHGSTKNDRARARMSSCSQEKRG